MRRVGGSRDDEKGVMCVYVCVCVCVCVCVEVDGLRVCGNGVALGFWGGLGMKSVYEDDVGMTKDPFPLNKKI